MPTIAKPNKPHREAIALAALRQPFAIHAARHDLLDELRESRNGPDQARLRHLITLAELELAAVDALTRLAAVRADNKPQKERW